MRAVDHDDIAIRPWLGKFDENPGKHTQARPADKAVVERLRRPVDARSILPLQPVVLDVDDAVQNPPVIQARLASGSRKEPPQPIHLRFGQPEVLAHLMPSIFGLKSSSLGNLKQVYGS